MRQELRLVEYGGQRCDGRIVERDNGSCFVYFLPTEGYGGPSLEEEQLLELLNKMCMMRGESARYGKQCVEADLPDYPGCTSEEPCDDDDDGRTLLKKGD